MKKKRSIKELELDIRVLQENLGVAERAAQFQREQLGELFKKAHELQKTVHGLRAEVAFYESIHLRQRELLVALGRIKNWAARLAEAERLAPITRWRMSAKVWMWQGDREKLAAIAEQIERLSADYETLLAGIKMQERDDTRTAGPVC